MGDGPLSLPGVHRRYLPQGEALRHQHFGLQVGGEGVVAEGFSNVGVASAVTAQGVGLGQLLECLHVSGLFHAQGAGDGVWGRRGARFGFL